MAGTQGSGGEFRTGKIDEGGSVEFRPKKKKGKIKKKKGETTTQWGGREHLVSGGEVGGLSRKGETWGVKLTGR